MKLKVLHFSDRNSPDFKKFYDECDVLFTTGDLSYFDFKGLEDKENKKLAFGVYGNHDDGMYMKDMGITNVHNKIIDFQGTKIGGFQGCIKYKESNLMFEEKEAKEFADNFPYVDILLLHAGPKDILDDKSDAIHKGSEHIKRYVLEKKPKYVFVGHQYSNDFMEIENTKIYRTYGAKIIEIKI